MSGPAWTPSAEIVERARLTEFLRFTGCRDFTELHRWSISDVGSFTDRVIRFLDIKFDRPYSSILDLDGGPEWPQWCVGAKLNITASCFAHDPSRAAIIAESEDSSPVTLTYGELREQVSKCAAGLKALGIQKGDRVALYMPMRAETVVALLATVHVGAIAVPLFSGYGPTAIETRLKQTSAKALIACGSFQRGGRRIDMLRNAREALERCPAVEHFILIGASSWNQLFTVGAAAHEQTSAEDPLMIVFSSGTSGEPKGIVHSHCSFPVKAAQDMAFNMDIHAGDRISWITDLGWMMGPWLIFGALILGATVVLYDGACDWPDSEALWQFTARHRLDVLGLSPSLVRKLAAYQPPKAASHDLSCLRFFASSGEPWDPSSWWWLFNKVRSEPVPIINYSGGTEISGGILSNHPLAEIAPCGFAAPCPGIAADVVNEFGTSLDSGVGELAIRRPWIGQARGFWRDPARYVETYWARIPGVWLHGDWAEKSESGQWYIRGRSDDTLKIAGKRVGPAEIESILTAHVAVTEAAVIGVPDEKKGSALVGFCVGRVQNGVAEELRERVARELGKPLKPERIHFVSALPKTRNGKIVRRAIRAAYLHEDAGDLTSLENPNALDEIRNINP
jgi:acetyl-CoA synthetase